MLWIMYVQNGELVMLIPTGLKMRFKVFSMLLDYTLDPSPFSPVTLTHSPFHEFCSIPDIFWIPKNI